MVAPRLAGPEDAAALVDLRAAMFEAMGQDVTGPAWRRAAREWFARRLAGDDVLVVVADLPDAGPVSCAMAVLEDVAPSPSDPVGRRAHLSNVSTLAVHRGRGLARACVGLLVAELDARGVRRTDLFATTDGEALYRSFGFRTSPYPALRRP
ncbi:GNAT family N-acetyltransferase [Amnibacterium setariae]|uniref:GNAT family N-acetyltransferase n=1 Tax=Amnibacterium setariae TaxID=2306585 RepID=A0A3A1U389_9MICO|nr:GNAT family N-acetyltransferase [Amnibacterium setariae]RIX31021.1 GNAT family N-acetyltransferase [Amnibacterium setariae]